MVIGYVITGLLWFQNLCVMFHFYILIAIVSDLVRIMMIYLLLVYLNFICQQSYVQSYVQSASWSCMGMCVCDLYAILCDHTCSVQSGVFTDLVGDFYVIWCDH